jgi:hypothetical protein
MDSVGTSTTTSFVIQNTPSSQTHWFSVRSRGPQSAVGRRAIAIKKTPGTFSCPLTATDITKSNSFGKPISVYPNPSEGIYNVEISQLINTDISYKIFDISGKIIQQNKFGKQSNDFFTSVNLSEFPTGIYTLAINVGENTHRVKLCKLLYLQFTIKNRKYDTVFIIGMKYSIINKCSINLKFWFEIN